MDWQNTYEIINNDNNISHLLEDDKETGKVLDDWKYLLKHAKEDCHFKMYNDLKNSIAKIDYDTLFIYSNSNI